MYSNKFTTILNFMILWETDSWAPDKGTISVVHSCKIAKFPLFSKVEVSDTHYSPVSLVFHGESLLLTLKSEKILCLIIQTFSVKEVNIFYTSNIIKNTSLLIHSDNFTHHPVLILRILKPATIKLSEALLTVFLAQIMKCCLFCWRSITPKMSIKHPWWKFFVILFGNGTSCLILLFIEIHNNQQISMYYMSICKSASI